MPRHAGFWIRVVAYLIDAILLNIATSFVGLILGLGVGLQMLGSAPGDIANLPGLLGGSMGFLASWLYFAIMESSSLQGTVGKKALGMIVTDEHGQPITFLRATGRYFAKFISVLILMVGFFMVGWTRRKQGLHDIIAGTLVFKARDSREVVTDVSVFQ